MVSIYFGAYKPWVKARTYTSVQRNLPSYRTLDEFIMNYDKAFDYSSPIGQEEVIKFVASQIENMIQNQNQTEEASLLLVEYIEEQILPGNIVHLLQVGGMYSILYDRFRRDEYFNKAEDYYLKTIEIAPNIPHPLYSLYELYKESGQEDKMNEIKNKILEFWPGENRLN